MKDEVAVLSTMIVQLIMLAALKGEEIICVEDMLLLSNLSLK